MELDQQARWGLVWVVFWGVVFLLLLIGGAIAGNAAGRSVQTGSPSGRNRSCSAGGSWSCGVPLFGHDGRDEPGVHCGRSEAAGIHGVELVDRVRLQRLAISARPGQTRHNCDAAMRVFTDRDGGGVATGRLLSTTSTSSGRYEPRFSKGGMAAPEHVMVTGGHRSRAIPAMRRSGRPGLARPALSTPRRSDSCPPRSRRALRPRWPQRVRRHRSNVCSAGA
jgi:hypothetical protein